MDSVSFLLKFPVVLAPRCSVLFPIFSRSTLTQAELGIYIFPLAIRSFQQRHDFLPSYFIQSVYDLLICLQLERVKKRSKVAVARGRRRSRHESASLMNSRFTFQLLDQSSRSELQKGLWGLWGGKIKLRIQAAATLKWVLVGVSVTSATLAEGRVTQEITATHLEHSSLKIAAQGAVEELLSHQSAIPIHRLSGSDSYKKQQDLSKVTLSKTLTPMRTALEPVSSLLAAQSTPVGQMVKELSAWPRADSSKDKKIADIPVVRVEIPEIAGEPKAQFITEAQQTSIPKQAEKFISVNHAAKKFGKAAEVTLEKSEAKELVLKLVKSDQAFSFIPGRLELKEVGQDTVLRLDLGDSEFTEDQLKFFIRDAKVADLEPMDLDGTTSQKRLLIKSHAVGVTEAYVVIGNQMMILPVEVRSEALMVSHNQDGLRNLRPLAIAKETTTILGLGGLEGEKDKLAASLIDSQVKLDEVVAKSLEGDPAFEDATLNEEETQLPPRSTLKEGLSLNQSLEETEKALAKEALLSTQVESVVGEFSTVDVTLQVVDERTRIAPQGNQSAIYPVAGALIEIPGTDFQGYTDSTGHIVIRSVPKSAELLVRVLDPSGAMTPTMAEIQGESGVQRVVVTRNVSYDLIQSLTGTVQKAGLSSLCAELIPPSSEQDASFKVRLLGRESEVFYTNSSGIVDTSLPSTSMHKGFCILNLEPGPLTLDIETAQSSGQTKSWTFVLGAYGSSHQFLRIPMSSTSTNFETSLFSMRTAQEEVSQGSEQGIKMRPVEYTEAFPMGHSTPMAQPEVGKLEQEFGFDYYLGSSEYFVESAEFESTIYKLRQNKVQSHVTPLIPRGFIEDMALYANIARDPNKGSVIAEFGHYKGSNSPVKIKLVDALGRTREDSWYYGDHPVTKSLFFNVDPGKYVLIVETRDGDWLHSERVSVYSETVSYLRMGDELRRHL